MSLKRAAAAPPIERTWQEQYMKKVIKEMRKESWSNLSGCWPSKSGLMRSNDLWCNLIRRSIAKAYRKGRYEEARQGVDLKNLEAKEWVHCKADIDTCWKA